MLSKGKYKKIFSFISEDYFCEQGEDSSFQFYNSKSYFIRFYAYLPLIYSLKKADFNENAHILDIGCADGPSLPTLNYYAKRIVGLDINELLVKKSRLLIKNILHDKKKINLLNSDGLNLPFRDESFNIIFCLEVLEHVKNPDKVIKEAYRTLKRNGMFLCTIPIEIGPSLLIRTLLGKITKFHRPFYTKKELINSIFLKRPGIRTSKMDHKNFDWRLINKEIKRVFRKIKIDYIPINILKNCNPVVLLRSIKE